MKLFLRQVNYNKNSMSEPHEVKETPVWRIILSIALALFSVIRLASTCSNSNTNPNTQNSEMMNNINQIQQSQEIYRQQSQDRLATKSNDILYTTYKTLDTMNLVEKKRYSVLKLEKDSMIQFDLSSKIKVDKGFYFQKNFDDTLRMAIKSPKDLTLFVHDLESNESVEDVFKSVKRHGELNRLKSDKNIGETKTYTYTFTKGEHKFNGYVLVLANNNYYTFVEFESETATKTDLRTKALVYLLENLKSTKKK